MPAEYAWFKTFHISDGSRRVPRLPDQKRGPVCRDVSFQEEKQVEGSSLEGLDLSLHIIKKKKENYTQLRVVLGDLFFH